MMRCHGHDLFGAVDLIVGYLLGELSVAQQEEYARLLEDTGLQEKDWNGEVLQRELQEDECFDKAKAWQQLLLRIPRKSRPFRLSRIRLAALWMLPLAAGGLAWLLWHGAASEEKQSARILPVASKAFIEMADGRNIELAAWQDSLSESDGTLIYRDSGKLSYTGNKRLSGRLIYNTLHVPRGGEYALDLSDGTKVWLNSDSRLRFPVQFTGECREVFLSGEAYFEVAPDTARPFVVRTSLGKVEVLGTEFNVQDYENERQVVTTLVNGKVRYSAGKGKDCVLSPGCQGIDSRNGGALQIRKVNLEEYVSWKDGLYTFYNHTLEEIMRTVERNYDVQVSFERNDLKALRFTGDLKKYDKVEKFLRFIETGGDVIFAVEGKTIRIRSK